MELSKAASEALAALNAALCHATNVGEAMHAAGGHDVPPWVWVYSGEVERIRAASEALEAALYGHRGVGGVAPDGDRKVDRAPGPSAQSGSRHQEEVIAP